MLDSITEVLNNELIRQIKSMEVELFKRMFRTFQEVWAETPTDGGHKV